ncbi:MAG: tRNA pseudouridine(55) synthase TruB [Bacillota bacterium]|nr:tRNA pseudouridine(55) synthase TruB [Bacillota bacterium]
MSRPHGQAAAGQGEATARRGEPPAGVINVLKPPGMTSHDVVACLRRWLGVKAGHGGTLDPGAAGVLVVALGRATRLLRFLLEGTKEYRAEVILGARTATGDAAAPEEEGGDASCLTRERVEEAVQALTGELEQVPPMTSALKHAGEPLYRLARRGEEVPRRARPVTVFSARVVEFHPARRARLLVDLVCSHGTYVRTWAQDLGNALGVGGYVGFLVRTRVGPFRLEGARTLEEIRARPEEAIEPMARVVEHVGADRGSGAGASGGTGG